jgi:tetratricopeptide (TPR) repeat protein
MAADDIIDPKWTDELRIYGEGFVGRQDELEAMDRAWAEGARIFALHAEGGAGKTRVVVEWLRRMRDAGWRSARRVFVHSFYSQGSDERRNASSDLFFEQALRYFGHEGEPITQSDERGRALARLLIETHGLLVLDGLEPLQHPPLHAERGRLKDPGIARLLLSLANAAHDGQPALCLITSRQPVVELQGRLGTTVRQQSLDHLHRDDGAELLQQFGVVGPDEELRKASDEFHGHAYSLMLLGSYLRNATDHCDIRHRREVVLLEEEAETRYPGHAQRMFAAYVRYLGENSPEVATLRLLGFFDRAAEQELLRVLRTREGIVYEWSAEEEPNDRQSQPRVIEDSLPEVTAPLLGLSQAQWNRVLSRLCDLRLIEFARSGATPALDAHPLLRECFAETLRTRFPKAWKDGNRRLYEHLSGKAPYWPQGIEALQPLYHAITHGSLAGLHQLTYVVLTERILRGASFYSLDELGAFGVDLGAVACFFATPWTTLVPGLERKIQSWMLHGASLRLRALGRLTEAVEPIRAGLEIDLQDEDWRDAAIAAGSLVELELDRGEIEKAVDTGKQSVTYADRSKNEAQQFLRRTGLAAALHQSGRNEEARRLFEDSEIRQAAFNSRYPKLYSLRGFQYCELLLAEAERAAWQRWLLRSGEICGREFYETICNDVAERASQTLEWVTAHAWLFDIAADNITLARVLLYKPYPLSPRALIHARNGVRGLRDSGLAGYLPLGLLTRACVFFFLNNESSCLEDLDEAREIAEQGPMPLRQADILLTRARLFRDRSALAEARHLIEKHGYHRRDGELADAEEAARGWDSQLSAPEVREPIMTPPTPRFDIALSFPGEHRTTVAQVAEHLSASAGRERVLYDKYYEAEFARMDLDVYLPRLYREQSKLIAIFLCPEYARKRWCQLEWRHIRQLIATVDADRIMLLSFGSPGDLSELGILPGDGYVDVSHRPASEIADLILQRLEGKALQSVPVIAAPSPKPESAAVKTWKEKLAYFQEQESITADPDQKFRLTKLIEEAQQKIRELERTL